MTYRARIDAEYGGILPYHEILYILLIRDSASKALEHYRTFLDADFDEPSPRTACFEFYSAIVQAANVSKCFWPTEGYKQGRKRAGKLRAAFSACDVGALKNRVLRNHIEHFDERLDKFLAFDPHGEIIDGFIGSIHACREPHYRVVRMVDPIERVASIFGYEFKYKRLFVCLRLALKY